jgi:two-component system response regulator PhoP
MRLLLVEDDPSLSRSLAAQLEQAGYAVDSAQDGREGLYLAREYPVDLAIIDLGLPTLSGVELIKTLRADGKAYPILVLTARDRWQDKVEALKLGADDYVVKPFNTGELLSGGGCRRLPAASNTKMAWTRGVLRVSSRRSAAAYVSRSTT